MSAEGEAAWQVSRGELHDAIQRHAVPSEMDAPGGALLTGWCIVAEFVDVRGERWLARRESEGLTAWAREGMLHNALLSDTWKPDADVEDD